jgi:hypothetical protein
MSEDLWLLLVASSLQRYCNHRSSFSSSRNRSCAEVESIPRLPVILVCRVPPCVPSAPAREMIFYGRNPALELSPLFLRVVDNAFAKTSMESPRFDLDRGRRRVFSELVARPSRRLPSDPRQRRYLDTARQELIRVSEIAVQTLTFNRQRDIKGRASMSALLDSVLVIRLNSGSSI